MGEQIVRAIQAEMRATTRAVEEQTLTLNSTLAPVARLPQLVEKQTESLLKAIYDSVLAQVTLTIAQHKGRLAGQEDRVKEELHLVDEIRADADEKAVKVRNEAREMLEQSDSDVESAVNQLDSPVLDLGRAFFPSMVSSRLSDEIIPNWQLTSQAGLGSLAHRRQAFVKELSKLASRIEAYRGECRALRDRARTLANDGEAPPEILVPIVAVEYEERGQPRTDYFIAPEYQARKRELSSSLAWLESMMEERLATGGALDDGMEECPLHDLSRSGDELLARYGDRIVTKRTGRG